MSTTSTSDFPPVPHTGVPQSDFLQLCRTDDPRGGAAAWAVLVVGMAVVTCVMLAVTWATGLW
jgi:hypothetical protein